MKSLDSFTLAYIECALWSSTDENGEPLDYDYTIDDISKECMEEIMQDCESFKEIYNYLLTESGQSDEQNGHDFWLTRNHHGVGFWDRGLGDIGKELTIAAQACGSVDLYVGDDGKIYV
jgi:hypothetical protein